MPRALTVDLFGLRFLLRWQVWATMASRITFVARVALYATILVLLPASLGGRKAERIFANGLEIDALARTDAADPQSLPIRVVTGGCGGGEVAAKLQWRTFDPDGRALGEGGLDSPGCATVSLPERARLGGVSITARSRTGERELWLDLRQPTETARVTVRYDERTRRLVVGVTDAAGAPLRGELRASFAVDGEEFAFAAQDPRPRARTGGDDDFRQLRLDELKGRECALGVASLGLFGLSFWIVGELAAFAVRQLVRRAGNWKWQMLGVALGVAGLTWAWPYSPLNMVWGWHGTVPPVECPLDSRVLERRWVEVLRYLHRRDALDTTEADGTVFYVPWRFSGAPNRARVDFRSATHTGSAEIRFVAR